MIPYFSNKQIFNKQILIFTFFVSFLSYVDCIYSSILLRKKKFFLIYRRILSDLSTSVAYILHFRLISVYILFSWPYFLFLSFLTSFLSSFFSIFLPFFLYLYLSFCLPFFLSFFFFWLFDTRVSGRVNRAIMLWKKRKICNTKWATTIRIRA